VSVIVPCYNEDQTVGLLVRRMLAVMTHQFHGVATELILVDDGSRRPLTEVLASGNLGERARVVRSPRNEGKGAAVRRGIAAARGDILVFHDADLEYDPIDLPRVVTPILKGHARVVYGSRFASLPGGMAGSHLLANRGLTWATNLLFGLRLTDMETGCKALTRAALGTIGSLRATEFELEPELTAKLAKAGYEITEVPIRYRYRLKGVAKIHFGDGFEAVLVLLRERFFAESRVFAAIHIGFKRWAKPVIKGLLDRLLPIRVRL
jgi:glycosyltransferase involved in cell wall biosynthesis